MKSRKIPREPHRYSGRTAMHADVNVHEPRPPEDPDSPLSFTMEGYAGNPPSAIIPFFWSPGWNSVQAINKYQVEVGGDLHGGNPGTRLFEPTENKKTDYYKSIPPAFSPVENKWLALPVYHIFGSEELSSLSPAVSERIQEACLAMNNTDAMENELKEGDIVEIFLNDKSLKLPVKLNSGFSRGVAGLQAGWKETKGINFPLWITVKNPDHE